MVTLSSLTRFEAQKVAASVLAVNLRRRDGFLGRTPKECRVGGISKLKLVFNTLLGL
jgi:hypothetical protein